MKTVFQQRQSRSAQWISGTLIAVLLITMAPLLPSNHGEAYAANKPKGNWLNHAAKSFASGKGTKSNPYIIKTAAQLAYLARRVDASHSKPGNFTRYRYYKLANDIDLSKHYWTPIGRSYGNVYKTLLYGKAFRGSFNGGGHTISGLSIKGDEEYAGLFGVCGEIFHWDDPRARREFNLPAIDWDSDTYAETTESFLKSEPEDMFTVIKNFSLKNVSIRTRGFAGAVCGYAVWMDISRCEVQGKILGQQGAGGVVGKGFAAYTKQLIAKGKVRSRGSAGGIASSFVVSNTGGICLSNQVNVDIKGGTNVGGIIGIYRNGGVSSYGFKLGNGTAKVNVAGISNVGGLVGYFEDRYDYDYSEPVDRIVSTSWKEFKVKGTVKGKKNVGGIAGYEVGQNIKYSYFMGKVIGKENTGGLIGYKKSGRANSGTIYQSFVKGTVTGGKNTGGFIGMIENQFNVNVKQSYFSGTIRGTENLGGVIGYARLDKSIFNFTESYVTGSLKGRVNTGGLIGAVDEDGIRQVAMDQAWISVDLSGQDSSKGALFGKNLPEAYTKIGNFYFDKTRAGTLRTGIEAGSGSPGSFKKPKAVTTGDLQRRKLAGLSGKVWLRRKPEGKAGWLPQLRIFAAHELPEVRSASVASAKVKVLK